MRFEKEPHDVSNKLFNVSDNSARPAGGLYGESELTETLEEKFYKQVTQLEHQIA